jgi:hypothetical protein
VLLQLSTTTFMDDPSIAAALVRPPWLTARQKWLPENVVKWTPLSAAELQRWLVLSYLMGIIKLPAVEDYWTNLFGMPSFGSYMSRDRFTLIKSMLQPEFPVEEAGAAADDRAPKVGLWLRILESNCGKHTVFMPKREVAIDEQSITCNSLWAAFTHQNRHKPSGQGFRIYSNNEVATGYTILFTEKLGAASTTLLDKLGGKDFRW